MNNKDTIEFEVYITNLGKYNEGEFVGKWLKLPTTKAEFNKTLNEIGVDNTNYEEIFFTDYSIDIGNLQGSLGNLEFSNFDELNYLAYRLNILQNEGLLDTYKAMTELENMSTIADAINYTFNTDSYILYPNIKNEFDLGYYMLDELSNNTIPDNIKPYIDFEKYGRDITFESHNAFTNLGYIQYTEDKIKDIYSYDEFKHNKEFDLADKIPKRDCKTHNILFDFKELEAER